ncbi:MAG: LysM peptidoglycan-binding domain-containing protein [Clostridia bacterium]|nr:LysM peptidoglycan-binding domain-containing protein [Clostridia bacterium]
MRKIIRKKRRCSYGLLYVLLFIIGMMMVVVTPTVAANHVEERPQAGAKWEEVRVEKGDTLWGIAQRYRRPRQDVRLLVSLIQEANGLKPSELIYPGQILLVPIE